MSYIKVESKRKKFSKTILKGLSSELIIYEKLNLPLKVAKDLQSYFESLIELGKRGTLHARRIAASRINTQIKGKKSDNTDDVLKKLFTDFAVRYKERVGGYTRIIKLNNRLGDNAEYAVIALV